MDFSPNRPGQINGTGDDRALFYKKFAGEVMLAFQEVNVMMPLHMVRTIKSGKSAAFPNFGKANSSYHVPGTELTGGQIVGAERIINIDNLLTSDVFIANIDEAMSEYEVRSIYSGEAGRSLGNKADKQLLRVAVLASRAVASYTDEPVGSNVTDANVDDTAANLVAAFFTSAQNLDERDVPDESRYAILKPAQYYLLVQDTTSINRDWGGRGSFADGKVLRVADIDIIKSNNVPTANAAVETGERNAYNGTFNTTVAVVFQKKAIGTVKLLDLAVESEYSVRHQGTLVVAKYAMGHGILRPACAVEIKTA